MATEREESGGRWIDIVTVPRERLMEFAGLPWKDVLAAAQKTEGMATARIKHGRTDVEKDYALLREIDNRAFLYVQNW